MYMECYQLIFSSSFGTQSCFLILYFFCPVDDVFLQQRRLGLYNVKSIAMFRVDRLQEAKGRGNANPGGKAAT
jgi:hypothetical protein